MNNSLKNCDQYNDSIIAVPGIWIRVFGSLNVSVSNAFTAELNGRSAGGVLRDVSNFTPCVRQNCNPGYQLLLKNKQREQKAITRQLVFAPGGLPHANVKGIHNTNYPDRVVRDLQSDKLAAVTLMTSSHQRYVSVSS